MDCHTSLATARFRYPENCRSISWRALTHVSSRGSSGNAVWPEVNNPTLFSGFQSSITPKQDDLGNCWRYTGIGVSDASVSAGRAEPIDEP
jgi:hypothetical protein